MYIDMKTSKFYLLQDSAWGEYPQINLNRYNQNTYLMVSEGHITGFMTGYGTYKRPSHITDEILMLYIKREGIEITENEYFNARYNN